MSFAQKVVNYKLNKTIVSYIGIINSYLQVRKKINPFNFYISRNKTIGFHPSGLDNVCPRFIVFQYLLEKNLYTDVVLNEDLEDLKYKLNNPETEAIFDIGHLVHALHQYSYLSDIEDIEYKVEVPVTKLYEEYLISGTADIVIKLQDNKWYVIDLKTIGKTGFYAIKDKDYVEENYLGYVKQLMFYMKGLGLTSGALVFICKDNSAMKEFFFDYDESWIYEDLKTARKSKLFLLGTNFIEMLPECKRRKGVYKECPFTSICEKCTTKKDLIRLTKKKTYKELIK